MPFEWGEAWDISSKENNGTVTDAIYSKSSGLNSTGGYTFDGDNDYINIPHSAELDGMAQLTFCIWANTSEKTDFDFPLSKSDADFNPASYGLLFDNAADQKMECAMKNNTHVNTIVLEDAAMSVGTWYHYCCRYNGTTFSMFKDGTEQSTSSITTGTIDVNTGVDIEIGAEYTHAGDDFHGTVDNVRIYNDALTDAEIIALYLNESSKFNTIYYTSYSNLSENTNFTISTDADYVFPDIELWPNSSTKFYSPVLIGNVTLDSLDISADSSAPTLSNFKYFALDSAGTVLGNETAFNFSNLEDIEKMIINFTLSDATGIFGDIIINYTANGTGACALGNNQSSTCYNFAADTWIEFKNETDTTTFSDYGNIGDYINCTYTGTSLQRNYSCTIDEHYNPNVWKHYPLNFSNISWQSGASVRIKKNTIWRVDVDNSNIPIDASEYKLDFRVNATFGQLPDQPLLAWLCNTTYTAFNGTPETSPYCQLVGEKFPADLQDDGTKYRSIFTKNLTQGLGNIGCVLIETDSPTAKYYSMKTYDYLGSASIRTSISTNNGGIYTTLADGYETELNLNWFYNSSDGNATQIVFKVWSNDDGGNNGFSSSQVMTWLAGDLNEPPLVDITVPEIGTNISGIMYINWTTAEPNGDRYTTNITIANATNTTYIAISLGDSISNYTYDTSLLDDGYWNLTVKSTENGTSELYSGNSTHQIQVDNAVPIISFETPTIANGTYELFNEIWANISSSNFQAITIYIWNTTAEVWRNSSSTSTYFANVTGLNYTTYYLNASVNDSAGNINWTETRTIILSTDVTPPNLTVYSPTNTTYENSTIDLSVFAVGSPETYFYSLDNASNVSFTPNTSILNLGWESWHTITISTNDSYGNVEMQNVKFYVGEDTTETEYYYFYAFLFLVIIIVFIIGYQTEDYVINMFGSMVLIVWALAIWQLGYPAGFDDLFLKKSTFLIVLMVGSYFLLTNSYKFLKEGLG